MLLAYLQFFFFIILNSNEIFTLIGIFPNRVFIYGYPNNSRIEAHYQSNGKLYAPSDNYIIETDGLLNVKLNILQIQKYAIRLVGKKDIHNGVSIVRNLPLQL
jgi:hypothetical protein